MTQETMAHSNRQSARKTRERQRRLGWLTEAQAALGWGMILIVAALLGVIYLTQASRIATVGRRVQFLQEDLNTLRRENSTLERQIAESQSLERLQQEAVRLGFYQAGAESIEYLIVPQYPVGAAEAAPQPPALLSPPAETMRDALWLAIKGSVDDLMRGEVRK